MINNKKIIELTERIKEIRLRCIGDGQALIRAYRWDTEKDLRITSNKRLTRLMIGLNVSFFYLSNSNQEELLKNVRLPSEKNIDIEQYMLINEIFLKAGFVSSLFFVFESILRDYLRYLDKYSYNASNGIMKVCNYLVDNKLQWEIFKFDCKVFDFLRLIRNSLHNNGVYIPLNEKEKTVLIEYKGNKYTFSEGKRLNFISWDLLLDIADDLRSLLFHISNNETVRSIYDLIPDTYAF